jgi:hypothetical protein
MEKYIIQTSYIHGKIYNSHKLYIHGKIYVVYKTMSKYRMRHVEFNIFLNTLVFFQNADINPFMDLY